MFTPLQGDYCSINGKWLLQDVMAVFSRRYLHQNKALEIFFADRCKLFVSEIQPIIGLWDLNHIHHGLLTALVKYVHAIILQVNLYAPCKNIWVTSAIFWSSQLHAYCVCDKLQTSRNASIELNQSLSAVEKVLPFVELGSSCKRPIISISGEVFLWSYTSALGGVPWLLGNGQVPGM